MFTNFDGRTSVARWETTGKDYLELFHDASGYTYVGRNMAGCLPSLSDDTTAIQHMESNAVAVLKSDRSSLRRVR